MKYKITKYLFIIVILMTLSIIIINFYIRFSTKKQIVNHPKKDKYDAILVLGAGIWNNKPSPILKERLDKAIYLYKNNISPKIIMSGDHGKKEHDEVNIMKEYAIEQGIPSKDIFMDHAGFSTYDSIYRTKAIFETKKIIIVTQKYHLYRSLYIANQLGLVAYGVDAQKEKYIFPEYRDVREIFARTKDFIKCIYKPKPTYLGKKIQITGNGDNTNDKK